MRMVDSKIYTNSNIKDCIDLFAPVKCEEVSNYTDVDTRYEIFDATLGTYFIWRFHCPNFREREVKMNYTSELACGKTYVSCRVTHSPTLGKYNAHLVIFTWKMFILTDLIDIYIYTLESISSQI